MSFANQALTSEYVKGKAETMEARVFRNAEESVRAAAFLEPYASHAMGIELDTLTPEPARRPSCRRVET